VNAAPASGEFLNEENADAVPSGEVCMEKDELPESDERPLAVLRLCSACSREMSKEEKRVEKRSKSSSSFAPAERRASTRREGRAASSAGALPAGGADLASYAPGAAP